MKNYHEVREFSDGEYTSCRSTCPIGTMVFTEQDRKTRRENLEEWLKDGTAACRFTTPMNGEPTCLRELIRRFWMWYPDLSVVEGEFQWANGKEVQYDVIESFLSSALDQAISYAYDDSPLSDELDDRGRKSWLKTVYKQKSDYRLKDRSKDSLRTQILEMRPAVDPGVAWTGLYRWFDSERLLYVGISNNVIARASQHSHYKDNQWWSTVVRCDVEWHPTRASALKSETEAIKLEDPKFNKNKRVRNDFGGN